MAPDNLRAKLAFLDMHPSAGFVHSNIAQIGAAGEGLSGHGHADTPTDDRLEDGRRFFHRLMNANEISAPSVMVRRSVFERVGGFDDRLPDTADWEMWMRIALFHDAGYLAAPLIRSRRRDGQEYDARSSPAQKLEQAYLAKMLAMGKHPDRVPDLAGWHRRVPEWCRDEAIARARTELQAGRLGLGGEFLRVALIACEGIPPGDDPEHPRRIVRHLVGVLGGPGGDPLDALETKLRESEGRAESAQARLDELRRTVDDRETVIAAMARTRVWRAAQRWWSLKRAAIRVIERMTPGVGVVDASALGRAGLRYDVTIYCPDRHIVYDGRTPDRHGVGGGLTARVRLARALASVGHRVTVVANCPREGSYDGVQYVPLDGTKRIRTDVLVLNTSGGGLDLRPIHDVDVQARCRIVWVQGMPAPQALHEVALDFLCAPSNFIRRVAQQEWAVPPAATFVAYNAADAARPPRWSLRLEPARDPYRLVYTSHPDKGLDAAIGVLRLLRRRDARYHLHVYGSARLSGQEESSPPSEDGLTYHGVIGQALLARALLRAGVSLNLQARLEPMPLAALEAMRAGCIVLASPVGGYPEIVRQGHNGFLVPGDHRDEATWRHAADLVSHLTAEPAHARYLRHHARSVPWDWTTMAWTWCGLWDWALAKTTSSPHTIAARDLRCGECGGTYLALADGHHCIACGFYSP